MDGLLLAYWESFFGLLTEPRFDGTRRPASGRCCGAAVEAPGNG